MREVPLKKVQESCRHQEETFQTEGALSAESLGRGEASSALTSVVTTVMSAKQQVPGLRIEGIHECLVG